MKVLLVGYGCMGSALATPWSKDDLIELMVVSPHCPQLPNFVCDVKLLADNYRPDAIIFAVKPQLLSKVAPYYAKFVTEHTVVVSVAAGFSLQRLRQLIGGCLVRAMPNLPIVIGQGVIGLYADKISTVQRYCIDLLFGSAGTTTWTASEQLIDAITAISGSGPAYFYYFTECLREAGEHLGLSPDIASMVAQQTFIGTAALLNEKQDQTVEELRQQVTSPNGTTAAALSVFEQEGLKERVKIAVHAAFKRAQELSQ
ncbi:MAG: pyrroline-5-carboxylate reductase [Candidatus Paracaedibacteraceae bacterium]|nr:pyrroline-5-carboxylate reductase [Candidatus Paracaedibacteraceae bacterium]